MLDLGVIADQPLLVVGLALAVVAVKAGLITLIARAFRTPWGRSLRLGLLLSQAGEFGFVLFAQAAAAQLILPEAASLLGAVVTLSMATTPFLMRLTDWLDRRSDESSEGLDGPDQSPETSAIVVGYGRFGQTVTQMMQAKRVGVTIIDKRPSLIERADEFGTKVYYGDGLRAAPDGRRGHRAGDRLLQRQSGWIAQQGGARDGAQGVSASVGHGASL